MPGRLVVATHNAGKLAEIIAALGDLPVDVVGLDEVAPSLVVDEDGATFEDNAKKKAMLVAGATGFFALGDDSGLEVDALGGEPGVRSARWAGPGASDGANNRRLLEKLAGAVDRRARYRCVLALAGPGPEGIVGVTEGVCLGTIAGAPRGAGGFGYDPLFIVEGEGDRRFSELTLAEKNRLSHRGRALERMAPLLRARFAG